MIRSAYEADFILGQFGQLESVPASLNRLREIAMEKEQYNGRQALLFGLYMQLLGIAGGAFFSGQMRLFLWDSFYASIRALERLADGHTSTQVYDAFIETARSQVQVDAELDRDEHRAKDY